jgi:hypothetical protein
VPRVVIVGAQAGRQDESLAAKIARILQSGCHVGVHRALWLAGAGARRQASRAPRLLMISRKYFSTVKLQKGALCVAMSACSSGGLTSG